MLANSESGSDSQSDQINDKTKGKIFTKKRKQIEDKEVLEKSEVDNELSEDLKKQKRDSLWEEFCKDLPNVYKSDRNESTISLTQNNDKSVDNSISDQNNKVLITKTYDFAGESISVTEESISVTEESNANCSQSETKTKIDPKNEVKDKIVKSVKRSGGLGAVLNELKKPKISTLQKSIIDWNNFKKDEGIEDELNQHNKSKNTFIERQAFLQRTDVRQFEIEKEVRAKNRAQRQLSKN
jgi:hypothetical protein